MTKIFLFISMTLLLLKETTSSDGVRNSRGQERETQQCDATSCSLTKTESDMALILYNEDSIPLHYKPQRQFSYLGHTLTIAQSWGKHGVAGVVWDSAVVLCDYLTTHLETVQGKRVLELGSGTGLVGMVAALAGGDVTLTERAEPLEHLQAAVSSNLDHRHHNFHILKLDWTHDHSHLETNFDVILGADIIYIEDTFPDLLRTLLHFMGSGTQVYLSCKIRYERDSKFLSMLQEHVHVSKVYFDAERDIHIYFAKR